MEFIIIVHKSCVSLKIYVCKLMSLKSYLILKKRYVYVTNHIQIKSLYKAAKNTPHIKESYRHINKKVNIF
jgi:hypothetical protein